MKTLSLFRLWTGVLLLVALSSCGVKNHDITPSIAFAPYINAYTGGMIASNASIRIELTDELPADKTTDEGADKLFRFTPSIKGTTRWINAKTIEFTPEPGQLKSGTLYNASFALGNVMEVDKELRKFEFSFRVQERRFDLATDPIAIEADETVTVGGELSFNETISADAVRKMLTATLGKSETTVAVDGTDEGAIFRFAITGIRRTAEAQTLQIAVDGSPAGIDRSETIKVEIPAAGDFRLHASAIVTAPEYGLRLVFTDRLSTIQDIRGMIALTGIGDYTIQVQNNIVMAYFTPPAAQKELEVTIDQGLQNASGRALGQMETVKLSLESTRPQVELLSTGTIMPSAGNIIVPFRAISLYAVDLKIIRIFENNILMFLQDNGFAPDATDQLRRAGRQVYKKTLRLNTDASKSVSEWQNYSLDLTGLIRQEPGAIYRIELSFTQAYAAYECADSVDRRAALAGASDLISLADDSNDDDPYWDEPNGYYYSGYDLDIDWNRYDWNQINNPCHYSYYTQSSRKATANVLVSNVGLIAKSNAAHTVWATVTNLIDTEPMTDAQVTAYNFQLQPLGKASADGNGFVMLQLKQKPFILVAEAGNQKGYLRMVDGEENMLSRFDVGGVETKKGLKGYIYGERGVWRPGDTLHVAFMLEDRGKLLPENHPVSLELFNPQGQFFRKLVAVGGTNGLYVFHIPTSPDVPTGIWNAWVKVGGAAFHKSLRIETVKPNRLKIRLNLPARIDAASTPVHAGIEAQWLTGATAHNLDARMEMKLSRVETQFKGYEKYTFNNPASKFESSTNEVFNGTLDDSGNASVAMRIPAAGNAPGMLNAHITCRVFEPGGDASIYTESVAFSPYPSYVGINFNRPKDEHYLLTDQDHRFDVVTLTPDGSPVSRTGLEYKIYRIGWSWWWENQNNESFDAYINNSSATTVASGVINTPNGRGTIPFRINYPDWGRYLVYVKDPQSGHATGGVVLIDWPSWRGRANRQDPDGIKMLAFSVDKPSYEAGETVTVTIPQTASKGRALIALENGTEVLHREWITLTEGSDTKYTFKVTEQMAPNIYVHISLLQPHAATVDLPIRMYGVMPVFVANKASKLTPLITMPDVLKPETGFEVRVKEQNGRPMTYTLAIVDEGLLDLTNYKTPDPWNQFYAREALGIRTWDLFDYVIGAYAGKYGSLFSIGGDDELKAGGARANRFKPVVIYLGPVTLKAGEEKRHNLRLPAYVGSVRVMVVACHQGSYGQADKTVPVRTPLMLLSSLPRVLSTGETIELPVNVFAMENSVRNVTVNVQTTGKLRVGSSSQSVAFSKPGDKTLYFPIQTGAATGKETVTITASGGNHTSKETIEIDVRNPNPPIVTFRHRMLGKGESHTFDYAVDGAYEGNRVTVEMARIPTVDISRRFDFLYDYSHYCTEQLASRALPLLYLSEFKELDKQEAERVKTNVTEAIDRLYGRQAANGSFMYWPGEAAVNEWATSYAGSFLVLARERGYNVNRSVINKWIAYQRSAAQNWRSDGGQRNNRYGYNQSDLQQAYRLYTLALAGAPEIGAMNRLKEQKNLSVQARWRLAAAYALSGKQDAAGQLIFNVATVVLPYPSGNPTYGSSARDEAMILETLTLMNRTEEAFKQARRVSQQLTMAGDFDTQTTAFAMIAMGQLAAKTAGRLDFGWTVNGQQQPRVSSAKALYQAQVPLKQTAGTVTITNGNAGTLYVALTVRTRPIRDTLPAIADRLRIDVSYTDLKSAAIDPVNLSQGVDFYAIVKVANTGTTDYTDLALTHIIPSGWEIYNERMIGSGSPAATPFTYQDIRDDRVLTYFDLPAGTAREIRVRLQASYAGTFVLPAIQCEAMYDPAARARTAAGRVTVANRK